MPIKMRNPQSVAKRWVNGLGNATAKIEEGVNSVQESPMARAAEKVQKYEAGILDAISSRKACRVSAKARPKRKASSRNSWPNFCRKLMRRWPRLTACLTRRLTIALRGRRPINGSWPARRDPIASLSVHFRFPSRES